MIHQSQICQSSNYIAYLLLDELTCAIVMEIANLDNSFGILSIGIFQLVFFLYDAFFNAFQLSLFPLVIVVMYLLHSYLKFIQSSIR